jgi:hypothetical protein
VAQARGASEGRPAKAKAMGMLVAYCPGQREETAVLWWRGRWARVAGLLGHNGRRFEFRFRVGFRVGFGPKKFRKISK